MKIYNTLTKKVEEFKAIKDFDVKMYSCGPTVYNYAHLGNLRTYINVDLLRRWLEYTGYEVEEVMNITDVEDKIIREANKEKVTIDKITVKFEKAFFDDLAKLNVEKPEHSPRATEEIPVMIKLIEDLLSKGIAYQTDDGSVYFSIDKFKDYGQLSGVVLENTKTGARIESDEYEKENAQDFVLWKAAKEGEPSWESPFGAGRPGWHIECSAMSMKYLGETLDIHAGGIDLLFPHHENEIAQSEASTGKPFVKYWFHGEHLLIEGQKMSKSLHNIYTLDDLETKFNVEPLAYRLLCLMSHYRERLNFTKKSIEQAQNTLNNLRDFVLNLQDAKKDDVNLPMDTVISEASKRFCEAMDDDLNSPRALAALFDFKTEVNKLFVQSESKTAAIEAYNFLIEIDKVLGLELNKIKPEKAPKDVLKLAEDREKARNDKEWAKSDEIRVKIEKLGYLVEDTNEGTKIRKVK